MREPESSVIAVPFDPRLSAHVEGLAALFRASHCPCFCRYWHFEGDKNAWLERCSIHDGENERELRQACERGSDEATGVVALGEGGLVVGWAKVSPASAVKKLYEQRYYRGLVALRRTDDEARQVLTVGCFLVHPDARRRGVTLALSRAAVALARARGASALEALPRQVDAAVADEELFMGIDDALRAAGLSPVHDERPYPVLRISLP